ncbi:MAG TPA: hypothetical protein VJS43_19420, partial [Candidatus Acidoferrales bacterium]|nr:hypothetical protein [Candidatus Acidoferrales bacterium]
KPPRNLFECKTREDREAIVEELCESRARLLKESGPCPDATVPLALDGKILRYKPQSNRSDKAAGYESKGFYDSSSCPPWDTWVCCAADDLISYVPRVLCGLAQRGLEVDTAECLRWADSEFNSRIFAL